MATSPCFETSEEIPLEAREDIDLLNHLYELKEKIGEGTYGKVYKAQDRETGSYRAIKRMRILNEEEGVPATALREILMLKDMRGHPHIVYLDRVFSGRGKLNLVFEFCDMDLKEFLRRNGKMEGLPLETSVLQLLDGLAHCHSRRVLHRDLKLQNVLVELASPHLGCSRSSSSIRRLVLADFGLSRDFTVPLKKYTHDVVTVWYRPPEILLGQVRYGPSADVWSLGVMVAEMATLHHFFAGDSEIDTLFKIFQMLGTPDEEVWPGCQTLQDWKQSCPQWRDTDFGQVRHLAGSSFGEQGVDFLRRCLQYNHLKRWSAKALLQTHQFLDLARAAPAEPVLDL